MQIVIVMYSVREIHRLMNDIYKEHGNKIKNIKKARREIHLVNEDSIKFISTDMRTCDGLRADVAIGPYADMLTITSNQKKKIWDLVDLENHLKNI